MIPLSSSRLPVSRVPSLRKLRTFWIVVFITVIILWPFSGLTAWHLMFFGAISVGIYICYSHYILPLIIYFSMMLLYFVITPLIQIRTGIGYYVWSGDVPDFGVMALAFLVVHLLGIFVGFQFRRFSTPHKCYSNTSFSLVGVALVVALALGFVAIVGFTTILLPRVDQDMGELPSYIILLRNIAKLIPAFLVGYFILESHNGLKRNARLLVFVVLALFLMVVSNPVNTSRFLSLFGLLVAILVYAMKFSRLNFLAWALAILPLYAIFALGLTSAMRFGFDNIGLVKIFGSLQTLEFSSYSLFLDAINIDEFAQDNYLFSHIFILVPRSIWPGKAGSIGIYVAENSGYIFNNVGLTSCFNACADYVFLVFAVFVWYFGILVKNINPVFEYLSFRN